ncbi:MAG TPA: hypothetical protein VFY83_09170 [Anaerolineales bacterium]|jgi:hypothetical protein|nr:hypothetical protein [Anaerolineales bacterium]
MDDSELLRKYEPVLRFAKSERFFPMAVEPYLEKCTIFPSGPQGVVGLLAHAHEPLVTRIGKLESGEYFLRFINDPLIDSDAWVWWGVLSMLMTVTGWFTTGWKGVGLAAILALVAAFIIYIQASPIRLRFFPAAFAALFFFALEVAPIWFFLTPHSFISVQLEYLVLLPLYIFVLFYLSVRTMKFIFDNIIPQAPGVIMDMLSNATETIARKSFFQYAEVLEKEPDPVYYGRVTRWQDVEGNHWHSLQYHFFYAFNDWRLAANGINHHEGDWEMVAVYLKNDQPYSLLLSQHGTGAMELWQDVRCVKEKDGRETTHPLIYVALGSHANYSKPQVIRSASLFHEGLFQRFIYWLDGLIHFLFLLFNPSEKERQIALRELATHPATAFTEETFEKLRDEKDHYLVSLPLEIATGEGFRIGYEGDPKREKIGISSSYIKRVMSNRKVVHPKSRQWKQVLLDPEPEWVNYKGLWGVKSMLKDESGPPGPKWDRPDKLFAVYPRKRWDKSLEWLTELENILMSKNRRKT